MAGDFDEEDVKKRDDEADEDEDEEEKELMVAVETGVVVAEERGERCRRDWLGDDNARCINLSGLLSPAMSVGIATCDGGVLAGTIKPVEQEEEERK